MSPRSPNRESADITDIKDLSYTRNPVIRVNSLLTGFDRGLSAERILDFLRCNGTLHFIIKFEGVSQPERVPSAVANERIPQMVIQYYEQRIMWESNDEE